MLLVMFITNNRRIMGRSVRAMNVLGWLTTAAMFAAAIGLVVTMLKLKVTPIQGGQLYGLQWGHHGRTPRSETLRQFESEIYS
jgi:hypothetical protein